MQLSPRMGIKPMTETVLVVRKDHPDGKVLINKSDMKPGDVEWTDEPKQVKSKPARPATRGN